MTRLPPSRRAVPRPDADLPPGAVDAETEVPRPDSTRVDVARLAEPALAAPARVTVERAPAARAVVPVADSVGVAAVADRRAETVCVVPARVEPARAEVDLLDEGLAEDAELPARGAVFALVGRAASAFAVAAFAVAPFAVAALPVPALAVPAFAVDVLGPLDPDPDAVDPDAVDPDAVDRASETPAPVVPVVPGDVLVALVCGANDPAAAGPGCKLPSPGTASPADDPEGCTAVGLAEAPAMVLSRVPALLGPAPFLELVLAMERFLPVNQPAVSSEESSDCVDGCTALQLRRHSATAQRNYVATFCCSMRGRVAGGSYGRPAVRSPGNRSQAARAPRRGVRPGPRPPLAATARMRRPRPRDASPRLPAAPGRPLVDRPGGRRIRR